MNLVKRVLLHVCVATLAGQIVHAQAEKNDIETSVKSCRAVQLTLAVRGKGGDTPTDDDFALAGKSCSRLQAAISKSDSRLIESEAAALRPLLSRLGLPPSTPREQLEAAESRAAKLKGEDLFNQLPDLAKRAYDAGEIDKAKLYSTRLLEMAPKYREQWNYGNAVFHGNAVLGRVALRRGDPKLAVQYLLAAGATPGSPQLDSFGPNMLLAKELLEQGHSEVVLEFLGLCRKFWKSDFGKLDRWSAEVKEGKVPEFGSNLNY